MSGSTRIATTELSMGHLHADGHVIKLLANCGPSFASDANLCKCDYYAYLYILYDLNTTSGHIY